MFLFQDYYYFNSKNLFFQNVISLFNNSFSKIDYYNLFLYDYNNILVLSTINNNGSSCFNFYSIEIP